ncbi:MULTISPECIES: RNA polymerase sigma factor [Actinosynnema]|uniref:RNA polymerase sigma factor n=1 Tax=Actinosynnema TaxID=40566 RepID=UPI0020A54102|nr:sigma-70 family RNA polymerase sigma factor [Actinosynnema pretiosum]MCP2092173.1 RNA polymerase sigma-70 factor, ECF subfamily [Actinosynnema pretiosum]
MGSGRGRPPDVEREERFRALHRECYPDLLRFVERRVVGGEAEDVVASAFLVAWRRLDEVPSDARPWLFGVARRAMANHRRGVLRRRALDVRVAVVGESGGEQVDFAGGAVALVDLERAWRGLSAADREVLALVAFDGLSGEQAAVVLGCRRTTFAMRLKRARERLASAVGGGDRGSVKAKVEVRG